MKCLSLFMAFLLIMAPAIAKKTNSKAIAPGKNLYYGSVLCNYPQYECIKVRRGQNWNKLFPDPDQRDLVQRLNRTYNYLWAGKIIVVPRNLDLVTLFDLSPFALKIPASNDKKIIVDQEKLAWAAYDTQGQLIKWGPISSGRDKCSDSKNSCLTLTGIFKVFSKQDEKCVSNAFPEGKGGAKMPYCMFFHKGYALHGSSDIPGYRASHGCIRMFTQDAKWLNEHFVTLSDEKNNYTGTVVIVRPLANAKWQGAVVIPEEEEKKKAKSAKRKY